MSYSAFLLVMSQLAGNRKARVVNQGNLIFFEMSQKKNYWTLSTQVYSGDGYLPSSVRSCVSSNGMLRWQQCGAYLKLDPLSHTIYLFQEIQMEKGKYIPFKHHLNNFSIMVAEWKELLQEFAESDYSFR
ncbi:MAG: hypothetical protein WA347_02725 [Rhabdochlamydiaceae bacterium]|jgi:hypothetical protein